MARRSYIFSITVVPSSVLLLFCISSRSSSSQHNQRHPVSYSLCQHSDGHIGRQCLLHKSFRHIVQEMHRGVTGCDCYRYPIIDASHSLAILPSYDMHQQLRLSAACSGRDHSRARPTSQSATTRNSGSYLALWADMFHTATWLLRGKWNNRTWQSILWFDGEASLLAYFPASGCVTGIRSGRGGGGSSAVAPRRWLMALLYVHTQWRWILNSSSPKSMSRTVPCLFLQVVPSHSCFISSLSSPIPAPTSATAQLPPFTLPATTCLTRISKVS